LEKKTVRFMVHLCFLAGKVTHINRIHSAKKPLVRFLF
jgi:hypothetical protein